MSLTRRSLTRRLENALCKTRYRIRLRCLEDVLLTSYVSLVLRKFTVKNNAFFIYLSNDFHSYLLQAPTK